MLGRKQHIEICVELRADTVPKLQLGSSVDGSGAAQQSTSTSAAPRAVQSKEQLLVGDLLAAIDHSARTGLRDLSSAPKDRENAGRLAQQLTARIAHLRNRIKMFTDMLAASIRSYVERTQRSGRDRDPGTWRAFRTRFKPPVRAARLRS